MNPTLPPRTPWLHGTLAVFPMLYFRLVLFPGPWPNDSMVLWALPIFAGLLCFTPSVVLRRLGAAFCVLYALTIVALQSLALGCGWLLWGRFTELVDPTRVLELVTVAAIGLFGAIGVFTRHAGFRERDERELCEQFE